MACHFREPVLELFDQYLLFGGLLLELYNGFLLALYQRFQFVLIALQHRYLLHLNFYTHDSSWRDREPPTVTDNRALHVSLFRIDVPPIPLMMDASQVAVHGEIKQLVDCLRQLPVVELLPEALVLCLTCPVNVIASVSTVPR